MSSHNIKKPNGGVTMRRVMEQPDPNENLLERVLSRDNVQKAWKRVKANKGVPGIDRMSIEDFPEFARAQWDNIRDSLMAGTYQPSPVKRVEIPKPGRSAHDAVRKVREYIRKGYRIAVDMDLSKFFDRVDHDVLMHRVARKIRDKHILRLIGKYLRAGVVIKGRLEKSREGVPQGGPLSPLLANILLDDLDKELEKRGHKFVRYADDFVILVRTQRAGLRVKESVTRFLERNLKLKVNQDKSRVSSTDNTNFLGFTFKGTKIRWSDKAFREFKRRVKRLTGRSWFVSMEYRYKKLSQYICGWMNYFGISEYYRPIPEIDHWLRRRMRMCYWKQWRLPRTKIRNLRKLGTSLKPALDVGLSRKGPWRLARTLATQTGMTNKWLKEQGLVSVKERWVNIHYPATAR
jgi:RNA-directed DNA polymerase